MDDDQHACQARVPEGDEPFGVRNVSSQQIVEIQKDRGGLLERHPVFPHVFRGLLLVPLEVSEDGRGHTLKCTRLPVRILRVGPVFAAGRLDGRAGAQCPIPVPDSPSRVGTGSA